MRRTLICVQEKLRLLPSPPNSQRKSRLKEGNLKMYNLEGLYQSDLPKRAILVYMYLSDRAGKEGQCFPAVPTIARQTKLSEATVHRAIKDLEKGGFLYVTGRQRPNGADSSNLYTLTNAEPGW